MKNHHTLLYLGLILGVVGFILVLASLGLANYIYYNNLTEDKFRYERIVLATSGQIIIFIGFACIHGAVIKQMNDSGNW